MVSHAEVAREYGELKQELAKRFPTDIYGYMDGKNAFVKHHEAEALAWRARRCTGALGDMNILRAGSLVLEPQITAHAAEMFTVLSDPAIYAFENSPPESLAWLERRFARLESRASTDGEEQWLNWVIRLPSGGLAGYVQATIARDRVAHIAYELGSAFWRQGIGSAAVSAVLVELAATYAVNTVAATLKSRNYRSAAFLRSLSFSEQLPRALSGIAHAPDELVMYKQLAVGLPIENTHRNGGRE